MQKESIIEQDIVLIYVDEKPAFYARVETIMADIKPKWWRVKLLMLSLPARLVTWIVDDEQIRGADFTMGGTPIRIEKLVMPPQPAESPAEEQHEAPHPKDEPEKKARVLSLHQKKQ